MGFRKETLVVSIIFSIVLIASLVLAWEFYEIDFENYVVRAGDYVGGMSDGELNLLVDGGMAMLSDEEQEVLSGFSSEEMLNIAKGTAQGIATMEAMSGIEYAASENLLNNVVESNFENLVDGFWSTPQGPVCPKRPGGTCTPSSRRCIQKGGVACQYTCGTGGTFGPGTQCASKVCHASGTRCGAPLSCTMLALSLPEGFGEAYYDGGGVEKTSVDIGGGGVGEARTEERCDIIVNDPGNEYELK